MIFKTRPSAFSFLTVFLSTRKPCKIAARVSPVEAVKYSGETIISKKAKRSMDGGKVYKMAFSNLSRSKKRTFVTVLSLSEPCAAQHSLYGGKWL